MILVVQPQWSFPAESWIAAADPGFWNSNPVARNQA
jgi:hypothetical protein